LAGGGEGAQYREQLPAGQAARLRRARAGRERGIQDVDVDAHVDRAAGHAGRDGADHDGRTQVLKVSGRKNPEAGPGVPLKVLNVVQRVADADRCGRRTDSPGLATTAFRDFAGGINSARAAS
jgi:hypothetical protein